jgi:hypothetical protein
MFNQPLVVILFNDFLFLMQVMLLLILSKEDYEMMMSARNVVMSLNIYDNQPEMTPHVKRASLVGFEPTTFGEHDQCSYR